MKATDRLKLIYGVNVSIFSDKTPQVHIKALEFLDNKAKFQVLSAFRGFGKTTIIHSIYSPTYALETQKDEYIKIFSQTDKKAKNFLFKTISIMDKLTSLGLFTQTKKGYKNQNGAEIIFGSGSISQDTRGDSVGSLRPTLIICDDIESNAMTAVANSKTQAGRDKIKTWFFSELLPALSSDGRLIIVGTILHNDSLIANLLQDKQFSALKIPIIIHNKSAWQSRFPLTKQQAQILNKNNPQGQIISIEEIRESLQQRGMIDEFYQEYMCSPVSEENRLFKSSDFKYFDCVVYEKENYVFDMKDSINHTTITIRQPKGVMIDNNFVSIDKFFIVSAMDLASDGSDETTILTCGLYQGNIYVLHTIGGFWNPFYKVVNVIFVAKTFKPVKFGIEKANAQNDFFYIAKNASVQYQTFVNVVPLLHGGKAKNLRISQLQPYFKTARIYFNRSDKNTQKIESELIDFVMDSESKKDNYIDSLAYMLQIFYGIGLKKHDKKQEYINPYSL